MIDLDFPMCPTTNKNKKTNEKHVDVNVSFLLSTKPSVEEMRLWSQSFDKLMKNPAGRNVFREFLRTEYSEENMLFWLACEDLKEDMNKSSIEEKARTIYEDYISILSPKEVKVLLLLHLQFRVQRNVSCSVFLESFSSGSFERFADFRLV